MDTEMLRTEIFASLVVGGFVASGIFTAMKFIRWVLNILLKKSEISFVDVWVWMFLCLGIALSFWVWQSDELRKWRQERKNKQ
jgi:hypothetical protein